MTNTDIHDLIKDAVERVVRAANPLRVVLFGSCARGEPDHDSDLDLLVIESEPFGAGRSRLREIGLIERAMNGLRAPTDILVYSADEVARFEKSPNHLIGRALAEGVVVYERP